MFRLFFVLLIVLLCMISALSFTAFAAEAATSSKDNSVTVKKENGKYYLVYSYGGKATYAFSESPLFADGTLHLPPEGTRIPCGNVPKSALFRGRRIFAGFECAPRGWGGRPVFVQAMQNADGTLRFAPLENIKDTGEHQ